MQYAPTMPGRSTNAGRGLQPRPKRLSTNAGRGLQPRPKRLDAR